MPNVWMLTLEIGIKPFQVSPQDLKGENTQHVSVGWLVPRVFPTSGSIQYLQRKGS